MKFLSLIKHTVSAAAALSLICTFTCCGSNNTEPDVTGAAVNGSAVTVKIWHYYNGSLKNSFDKMVDKFNRTEGAKHGIVVEAHSQGNISDLETEVKRASEKQVGSDSLPNIFTSYADTAYEFEKAGLLANLDLYFTPEEQAEYVDYYIEEGRIGSSGELIIFPIAKSTETFMINKTDWEPFASETGASYEALKTVEGLTETARSYYEWTDSKTPDIPYDGRAFFGRDAAANFFIVGSKQLGYEIFSVENDTLTVTLDDGAMRKIWDNYYVPYISGFFCAEGKYRSDDAKVGRIISLVGSTASAMYFPAEVADEIGTHAIEADILPVPVFDGGSAVSVQQGAGMVVTKSTPEEEAASVLFLKWFTENENNIEFSAASGYLPVKKEANDYNYYLKTAEKLGIKVSEPNNSVIKEAFDCIANSEMYTSKAFYGAMNARSVLERSLTDKASADRATVIELLAGGASLEEAVEQFNTNDNFSYWLDGLKSEISAAVNQNE